MQQINSGSEIVFLSVAICDIGGQKMGDPILTAISRE
jgi:hypothetical protein